MAFEDLMNRRMVVGIATLVTAVVCSALSQDTKKDTLEYRIPEVVVTAPRMVLPLREIPFATSIVGRDVIAELPRSISMDEPMKLVPGVKVDNQANGARVHLSIRGQGILTERGIRGIKILLDGIPLNDPTGFAPDFFDVEHAAVDRIEVLRGPAASLYGGSASGGIINIITRNAPNAPLSGDASFTGGSNGFWKAFGAFGGSADAVNYTVSFSRTMGDGYRDHTHFQINNVYGKATYTPSASLQLTPVVSRSEAYHENPEGINLGQYLENPKQANPDAIPFNEYLSSNRTSLGLLGSVRFDDANALDFNGYVKNTLFTEANNRTFTHRTLSSPGASVQFSNRSGDPDDRFRNRVSLGADFQWQTIDEHRVDNHFSKEGDTLRSKEQIKQSGVGLFLIDKLDIGPKYALMVCVRYDDIHNELNDLLKDPYNLSGNADFSRTTFRLGFTYTPTQEYTVFASWGQGFLPPATEELAQNPDHFGGFNTHLTSATSEGFEVGVRHALSDELHYELTCFFLATQNDFDRYRISDPQRNQETFYRNAASSRRTGAEFYLNYTPSRQFELQAAYTFSGFQYTNAAPIQVVMDDPAVKKYIVDGNWLPNSPRHQLYVDLQYNVTWRTSVGVSAEALGKTFIDGANVESEAAEGYTLVHARARYGLKVAGVEGELVLQLRNILDTKYVAFTEPDPGGNAYQPGSGREIFGGLRIRL
jgi:iron complex outermembrane recepter protein